MHRNRHSNSNSSKEERKAPSTAGRMPTSKRAKARITTRRVPTTRQLGQSSNMQPDTSSASQPTGKGLPYLRTHIPGASDSVAGSDGNISSHARRQQQRYDRLQKDDAGNYVGSIDVARTRLGDAPRNSTASTVLASPGSERYLSVPVEPVLGAPLSPAPAQTSGSNSKHRSQIDEDIPGAYRVPGSRCRAGNRASNHTPVSSDRSVDRSLASTQPYSSTTAAQYSTGYDTHGGSTTHTGLTQASPIVNVGIGEGDRQRIREEVEVVVHNKLASAIAVAEAEEEHNAAIEAGQLSSGRIRQRRRCLVMMLLFVLLLSAVGVVVGFIVSAGNGRDDNDNAATDQVETAKPVSTTPASEPPTTPTIVFIPPIPSPITNANPDNSDTCFDAIDLSKNLSNAIQSGIPLIINGSTADASFDEFLSPCGVESNGRGVWYQISADSLATPSNLSSFLQDNTSNGISNSSVRRLVASTCHDLTQFDTQLSVYRGTCQQGSPPLLRCVAGNDQIGMGCGDSSRVSFVSEPTTDYYIYVHGFRNTGGFFQLSIEPLPNNDRCEDAISIDESFSTDEGTVVFGSTRGATIEDNLPATCGFSTITGPGVWYTYQAASVFEHIWLTAQSLTGFVGNVAVYRGNSCSELTCATGYLGGSLDLLTMPNELYYILIYGTGSQQGDFVLTISSGNNFEIPPDTSSCETATEIGVGVSVEDFLSRFETMMPSACGGGVFIDGPGVWYSINGTDGILRASTCNTISAVTNARISVFSGNDCDDLVCIGGSDAGVGCLQTESTSGSFLWPAIAGKTYYVLVHGTEDRDSAFELSVGEVEVDSADTCRDALQIMPDGSPIVGTLLGSTIDDDTTIPKCSGFQEWSGVWYRVGGTGNRITASTCDGQSDRQINLVVYDGDCDSLRCTDSIATPCGRQSSVTWHSTADETYFILVQSPMVSNDGVSVRRLAAQVGDVTRPERSLSAALVNTSFTMSVQPTTFNDQCNSPIGPVQVGGSPTFGSTRSATIDTVAHCFTDSSQSIGRGLWYTVFGNGSRLTATTATGFTTFATMVSVFTGSCNELVCVSSSELSIDAEGRSTVTWDSVDDELYSVLVSGSGVDELGEFAMYLSIENGVGI